MKTAIAYASGNLGGLATAMLVWLLGSSGVTALLGVSIAPALTSNWIYSRMVWGGLWAGLFLLPIMQQRSWYFKAAIFSLGPSLLTWFFVFPFKAKADLLGLEFGLLTPFLVIVFNLTWAMVTAIVMDRILIDQTNFVGQGIKLAKRC